MKLMILIAPFLTASCNSEGLQAPPVEFQNAAATRSCAPADGPAVAIYLASAPVSTLEPATPYIRLDVWKQVGEVVGSWSLSPSSADGAGARFQSGSGSIESATSGTVVVLSVGSDSTITGNVDLRFSSSGRVRGGFTAHWIPRTFLCG